MPAAASRMLAIPKAIYTMPSRRSACEQELQHFSQDVQIGAIECGHIFINKEIDEPKSF
jgi:hypothetical protein